MEWISILNGMEFWRVQTSADDYICLCPGYATFSWHYCCQTLPFVTHIFWILRNVWRIQKMCVTYSNVWQQLCHFRRDKWHFNVEYEICVLRSGIRDLPWKTECFRGDDSILNGMVHSILNWMEYHSKWNGIPFRMDFRQWKHCVF